MLIYGYDKNTKEYLGSMEAYLDPLESLKSNKEVYVIPPNFTIMAPPEVKEGEASVFNGNKWEIVKDHRGLFGYNKKTGEEVIINTLGDLPEDFVEEKPIRIEDLKAELVKSIEQVFLQEFAKKVSYGKIVASADVWAELLPLLQYPDYFTSFPVTIKDEVLIVNRQELEEAVNYFYARGMLLIERKKELIKSVFQLKSKKKLQEFVIDFDIEREAKKLSKLSVEEINEIFNEE